MEEELLWKESQEDIKPYTLLKDCTISPCPCLAALIGKEIFLTNSLNVSHFNLYPLSLVLLSYH